MLGFFRKPKLLISSVEKVELESEVVRLQQFFDARNLEESCWEQPAEYIADFAPDNDSVEELFTKLRDRLQLDENRLRLIFSLEEVDSVSGILLLHNRQSAFDAQTNLLDPEFKSDIVVGRNVLYSSLHAELIRVLITEKLILDGYQSPQANNLAYSAEVATAFFGFGLFTVNETVSCCQTTSQLTSYFSIKKLGAINSFGIGYLLALLGWKTGNADRTVVRYLRPDAELSYRRSLKYLESTNDSLLSDNNVIRLDSSSSIAALEAQLQSESATTLIWVLRLIEGRSDLNRHVSQIKPTLFRLLEHKDQFVRQLSLHLISFAERLDDSEIASLLKVAKTNDHWSNAVAANVLSIHLPFNQVEREFSGLVERSDHSAAANAAQIANRYGKDASKYSEAICERIRYSLNRCDFFLGKWYVLILMAICDRPHDLVQTHFADDEELLRGALDLLGDAVDVTEINPNDAKPTPAEMTDVFAIPAWLNI